MKKENKDKIILDLCGGTGSWSRPYKDAGYDVRVITLPEYDITDPKVVGICVALKPYGILAAPPCTKFSRAAWNLKKKDRDFHEGMKCVRSCLEIIWRVQEDGAPLVFWAMENPQGYLTNFIGRPYYYCQPWWFGDKSFTRTKRNCFWGYFNQPARRVFKRDFPFISPRTSKRDQVDKMRENKGWYKASAEDRAKTSQEFAEAFYKANK